MICRPLLSMALLQGAATALLDTHINRIIVNHISSVSLANVHALTARAVAVGGECAVAEDVLNSCVASGLVAAAGVPAARQQACLCCSDGAAVAGQYSSCATFLAKESPTETSLLSAIATLYGVCATGVACDAPSETQAPPPPACTSVADLYQECMRSAPGMEDVLDGDDLEEALAGCVCFDGRGTFNTEFDDFARTCLPWAQSVAPEDFETISHFATFCAARSTATVAATTTQAPVVPTVAPTAPATATSTGLAVTRAAPGGGLVFAVLGVVMLL